MNATTLKTMRTLIDMVLMAVQEMRKLIDAAIEEEGKIKQEGP